jgi:hypothetical protein
MLFYNTLPVDACRITKARFLYQIVNGAGLAMGALGAYLGIKYGTS